MISDQTVTDYVTLFRGRGDAYGSDDGKCIKKPLTRETFTGHLLGHSEPIGVYPIVPVPPLGAMCVWGCSDFDTADSYEHAVRLHEAFMAAGIITWIERSRSKGFHVWAFSSELVPAVDMRRMFLAAHQVADVPAREVNPKQTELRPGQYGNYVRLPYPNALDMSKPNQRVMDTNGVPMPLDRFVVDAIKTRIAPSRIKELADMYVEPEKATHVINPTEYDASLQEAMTDLSPLGKVIWRDGPLKGSDRSRTLMRLGYECAECGLNPSQTRVILLTADKRWGKYHLRFDGEKEIDKLVIRAYK